MKRLLLIQFVLFTGFGGLMARSSTENNTCLYLTPYERKVVASCLILEAASEGEVGMRAVLNVIHNRAGRDLNNVMRVVTKPYQFSCFNKVTTRPNPDFSRMIERASRDRLYLVAYQLVLSMERGELVDNTYGADHYHVKTMKKYPYWSASMQSTAIVGAHIFYDSQLKARYTQNDRSGAVAAEDSDRA